MQRSLRLLRIKQRCGTQAAVIKYVLPSFALAVLSLLASSVTYAQTQPPLNAIDWLTIPKDQIIIPRIETSIIPPQQSFERADQIIIDVTTLDAPSDNRIGLLPPKTTGLPYDLWGATPEAQLSEAVLALSEQTQPALAQFLITLLLAETAPPLPSAPSHLAKNKQDNLPDQLFRARITTLLRLGALEQARALLEQADLESPQNFAQWFDSALIIGDEEQVCGQMAQNSRLAPSPQARIFCFARNGDWGAAALILRTSSLLGDISQDQQDLLWAFLDPSSIDETESFRRPLNVTPLDVKLFASIGEPLPTHTLPLFYAHADLDSSNGLKTQLEAAERLARHNMLPPDQLLSLYTERTPSASGGVWTRAKAAQSLMDALTAKNFDLAAREFERIWPSLVDAGVAAPLAEAMRDPLQELYLNTQSPHALLAGLLTSDYEAFARLAQNNILPEQQRLLIALALDEMSAQEQSQTASHSLSTNAPLEATILKAFTGQITPPQHLLDSAKDELGLSLLNTFDYFDSSGAQTPHSIAQGLAFLRHLGLDNLARQTALQILILEPKAP